MADGRSTRLALDELLMKVAPENRVGVLREYGEMVPPPTVNLSTPVAGADHGCRASTSRPSSGLAARHSSRHFGPLISALLL